MKSKLFFFYLEVEINSYALRQAYRKNEKGDEINNMKIGKKSYMFLPIVALIMVVMFFVKVTPEQIQASDGKPKISTKSTDEGLSVTLQIPNPEKDKYILVCEGIERITAEALVEGISSEFSDKITISDTEEENQKIIEFLDEGNSAFELAFEVYSDFNAEKSMVQLLDSEENVITERTLDFTSFKDFSSNRGLSMDIQGRAWTGSSTYPENTIPLNAVFNTAVGSGPSYLDDGKVLQIIGNSMNQVGAIWSKRQIDLTRDFQFTSYIYLGNGPNYGTHTASAIADGITMTFHNDLRAAAAIGASGGYLGAYGYQNNGQYIRNAISLEFDPFGGEDPNDRYLSSDISRAGGHIGIVVPSANNATTNTNHYGVLQAGKTADATNRMSNDTWRELDINWDSSTNTLKYAVEGFGEASYTVADLNSTFGGTKVYWGFTGATGEFVMDAKIAMTEIPAEVSHSLKVENITQSIGSALEVQANKGDTVRFTDTLVADDDAVVMGDDAIAVITLPEGLTYTSTTMKFDGTTVDANKIEVSGQKIKVSGLDLVSSSSYDLSFDVEVTSEITGISLSTTVEVFSSFESSWGVSNKATVTIPTSLTVNFVDEDGTELRDAVVLQKVANSTTNLVTESSVTSVINDLLADNYEIVTRPTGETSVVVPSSGKTVQYVFRRVDAVLTVEFLNEGEQILSSYTVTIDGQVADVIDLTKESSVVAMIKSIEDDGYQITERPSSETEVELTSTSVKVVYKVKGTLSIFSAPTTIDFGVENVAGKDIRVDTPTYDEDFVIRDKRYQRTEWYLTAELESPLTRQSGSGTVLEDAIRYRKISDDSDSEVILNSIAQEIVARTQSTDTYNISDEWRAGNTGFKLEVPAGSVKGLGEYQATILWVLSETR